ncbi:MAG: hypothetical protein JSS13_10095 [Proteobacteria bacterium]|nr:hypothetical protein [Pseudomonadota bacterium]
MWKWLRNGVLLAIVLAGVLKLAAWYAVGKDAQRVVDALAPYADIKYDGLGAGLDGSVSLIGVSVAPVGSHRVYRADAATLDSPGLLWLLKHAALHENELPAQFGITFSGVKWPPEPWLDPQWFDPATYVLFASAGCQTRLDTADYLRMGMDTGATSRDRFEYRYDPGQHTLTASVRLSTPGFADLALEADVSRFDPAKMLQPGFWDTTRIDQLSATYADNGFMSRRNDYCAKRESLSTPQFVDHHATVVEALLQESRIQPDDELMRLYKTLVVHGGSLRLLSLPNAVFSIKSWKSTSREELLRQLNVTARYQDKPPIMFRLAFMPESSPDTTTPVATDAASTAAPAAAPTIPSPALAPATVVAPAMPPALKPEPKPEATGVAKPASSAIAKPVQESPPVAKKRTTESASYLDKAESRFTPPLVVHSPAPGSEPETRSAPLATPPASTPIPENSTQALVWKPGIIEQLPESTPVKKDYTVVEFPALAQLTGRHVRLITRGGKQIEGFVAATGDHNVQLRIERGGGSALVAINRDSITQIQLLHW